MTQARMKARNLKRSHARPGVSNPVHELQSSARDGKLVVIIGTGVSIALTDDRNSSLSWRGLIRQGLVHGCEIGRITSEGFKTFAKLLQSRDLEDLLQVADFVGRKLGAPGGDLYARWLEKSFKSVEPANEKLTHAICVLRDASIPLCTLNYDSLLEKATGLPAINLTDASKATSWMRRERPGVLHLHGSWDVPLSCVLGNRDYDKTLGDEMRELIQRSLASFTRLLFIGCGDTFADPNFSALIRWLRTNAKAAVLQHYALVTDREIAARQADPSWLGFVEPLSYGPTHDHLSDFLLACFRPASIQPLETSDTIPPTYPLTGWNEDLERLRRHYQTSNSKFVPLRRNGSRSATEMIKDVPDKEDLLPLMARIPEVSPLSAQVDFLHKHEFSKLYCGSWIDHETALIGTKMIELLPVQARRPKRVLDVGCGNCAQYRAMCVALPDGACERVDYNGQDYNPDWKGSVDTIEGIFHSLILPQVPPHKFDLVACAHVLQDQVAHPIVLFASLLAFNSALKRGGYCYITIPVKDAYPGLLDALELCASKAEFRTVSAGTFRLQHSIFGGRKNPRNITSFDYLVLKKSGEVDAKLLHAATGLSFLRWQDPELAKVFGVTDADTVSDDLHLIEKDLNSMLRERNDELRAIWRFSSRLWHVFEKAGVHPSPISSDQVQRCIENMDFAAMERDTGADRSPPRSSMLAEAIGNYLTCLILWLFHEHKARTYRTLSYKIFEEIGHAIQHPENVRVQIAALETKHVLRLLRHLVSMCQKDRILLWEITNALDANRAVARFRPRPKHAH